MSIDRQNEEEARQLARRRSRNVITKRDHGTKAQANIAHRQTVGLSSTYNRSTAGGDMRIECF